MLEEIALGIENRSAQGIAAAISRLVTANKLAPGDRLPTVRALAQCLGTSPTTVSEAWQTLARVGAIETRGRLGSFVVRNPTVSGAPRRYREMAEHPAQIALDLSTGTPDADLLPDLGRALRGISRYNLTTSYLDDPVLPQLDVALRATWPFEPSGLTVVDGAMDALDRITSHLVRLGDRVLVENPCFPPLHDLLEQLGAEPIGLELDDQGVTPEALRAGLDHDPVAVFIQPRAHNPAGVSMSASRARRLATILRPSRAVVVEDDHAGDIASSPAISLGAHLPDRTVLIRSFSKSHGPDLRLAAVGGAQEPVSGVVSRRLLGPGWSSRLLQLVLVELLADPQTCAAVCAAREAYADRRRQLTDALRGRGVRTTGSDGINLWVEVADERSALITLAARGIGVAPGSPFLAGPNDADHVRVTISTVRSGYEQLADDLALAAIQAGRGQRPRR